MKIARTIILGAACLLMAACGPGESAEAEVPEGFESVQLSLETVTLVRWERVESAFRYRVEADGVELGNGVGDHNHFVHDGPFDDLKITASSFQGEELGPAQLKSIERVERLVLRWDEAEFERPFLGLRTENGGSRGTAAMEVSDSPHVIGSNPEHVKAALFGEAVEPIEGRIVPSPFSFDGSTIVEHGPFIHLPLP